MMRSRPAFSFTEVLFAVMILGIGFIMVAAMFPVAIQQAKNSTEETTAAAVSRGGANYIDKVANNSTMPPTNGIVVGPDYDGGNGDRITLSRVLRGSMVVPSDSRVAWVPLYRRSGNPEDPPATWSPYAQVFMIPVVVRHKSDYSTGAPVVLQSTARPGGLPVIEADFNNGTNGAADTITFRNFPEVASEGAYVIIANAYGKGSLPAWDTVVAPDLHGRIYRLGGRATATGTTTTQANTWELTPGADFEPIWYDLDPARQAAGRTDGKETQVGAPGAELRRIFVFVVGRATNANGTVGEGTSQDVAAYTTFVNVN